MSKNRLALSLLFVALAPLACAEDEAVADDVASGWRTTSKVMGEQQLMWDAEADEDGDLAAMGTCPDGGSASVEGTYDSEEELSVTMTFDGCRAEGITIAGNLAMTTELVVEDDSVEIDSTMRGSLRWSGAVEGSCAIDMRISARGGADGSAAVSISGDLCGYDAYDVVEAAGEV